MASTPFRPSTAQPLFGPYTPSTSPPLAEPTVDGGADALLAAQAAAATADGTLPIVKPNITALPSPIFKLRSVRAGCWLVSYTPLGVENVVFDGTIRVEAHADGRTASGDLYQRPVSLIPISIFPPKFMTVLGPAPSPAAGIPTLARSRYRYYLRITQILEQFTIGTGFPLGFEMYRFTAPNTWVNEGAFTAQMTWMTAPSGYPSAANYLEGDVRNAANVVVGRLKMGWVSNYLRKAVVEIDAVAGSERPLDNGAGIGWAQVFDAIGWQVTVNLSDTNVAEPSGAGWSDAEMHAAMLARRSPVNLDTEWRYHILCVRTIDSTPRGIMYDAGGTDSNNVPREGVGISTHWTIPNTAEWGLVKGQRFGASPAPFFRTAVHELGHAMALYHTTVDMGFMNTTDVIAANATATTPFPNNIKWGFADVNLQQLRHYPDVFVRPGGAPFGGASTTTPNISPRDLGIDVPGLTLEVRPLLAEVPIGAPVRVEVRLVNGGELPMRVPAKLSLKSECLHGEVRGPNDAVRTFRPLVVCLEDRPMRDLAPGEALTGSLTLMRGAEGALFPTTGLHEIAVEVHWELGEMEVRVNGSATVLVTGARDAHHAAAAHRVLATPDAHLVLALGGDHMTDGIAAIDQALDDPVLRPHYAAIEAKRLATRFGRRAPALERAASLVDERTVMSDREAEKLEGLAKTANGGDATGAKALRRVVKARRAEGER